MDAGEWVEAFITSPADPVSRVIGLLVIGFLAVIIWFLVTEARH
jgi:hypothetical protein